MNALRAAKICIYDTDDVGWKNQEKISTHPSKTEPSERSNEPPRVEIAGRKVVSNCSRVDRTRGVVLSIDILRRCAFFVTDDSPFLLVHAVSPDAVVAVRIVEILSGDLQSNNRNGLEVQMARSCAVSQNEHLCLLVALPYVSNPRSLAILPQALVAFCPKDQCGAPRRARG